MDNFSRESLSLRVGRSLGAEQVLEELDRLTAARGAPRSIRVDNGTEFTSRLVDQWAYWNGVTLDFSRPGRPMEDRHIEAFAAETDAAAIAAPRCGISCGSGTASFSSTHTNASRGG